MDSFFVFDSITNMVYRRKAEDGSEEMVTDANSNSVNSEPNEVESSLDADVVESSTTDPQDDVNCSSSPPPHHINSNITNNKRAREGIS